VCGLSANQQSVCYFEYLLDCLSNLVHKISYTGSTSPLDTVSQNQLQNLILKRLLEFLLNSEFVWFQTKQFSGCICRLLGMLFFWNKHLKDLHGHAFACAALSSNVSSERTHSDSCNLFFNEELLLKIFSSVSILWKKLEHKKTNFRVFSDTVD
jgi:hypothetical protein